MGAPEPVDAPRRALRDTRPPSGGDQALTSLADGRPQQREGLAEAGMALRFLL